VPKKKLTSKKAPGKTKVVARGKTVSRKKTGGKKPSPSPAVSEIRSPEPSTLEPRTLERELRLPRRGTGSGSAGQSGDLQGLSTRRYVDSESVKELAEEGQAYEAEVLSGVEGALDPDEGEVRTREIPGDDIPKEYLDKD